MKNSDSCGQLIIMGLPGPELTDSLRNFIRRIQPGGFILFTRNLESAEQVFQLNRELNELCEVPPIITIDQEGGRVSRLKVIGEEPPSAQDLRKAGGVDVCREHGVLMGDLLAILGFNLNLAPVVDFSPDDDADNSLRGRCWGSTPEEAIEKAGAFLEGMQSKGILGTAKHFPGYTFCELDPHGDLPLIRRTCEQIEREELKAFRAFLGKAEAMMIGHAHFTAWHEKPHPASLSTKIIDGLLRKELGYKGLVMTDDLEMGAIANLYGSAESARLAMEAGEDMLLICHNPACVEISYDTLCGMPLEKTARAKAAVAEFKKKMLPPPLVLNTIHLKELHGKIAEMRRRYSM